MYYLFKEETRKADPLFIYNRFVHFFSIFSAIIWPEKRQRKINIALCNQMSCF